MKFKPFLRIFMSLFVIIFISYFLSCSQEKATVLYLFKALNPGQNKLFFLRNDNTVSFL